MVSVLTGSNDTISLTIDHQDFVKISVDLAHEYVKLGKTQKGVNVYRHTLSSVKDVEICAETRVFYLLRFAESQALMGSILKRYTNTCLLQPC